MSSNSNNIYNILNKLKAVAGLNIPATPAAPKATIYESVAPRGDIKEAITDLESKYKTFKESTEGKQFKDISIGGKFVNGGVACTKTGEDTAKVTDSGRVIYLKPTSKIDEGREHKDKDSFDTNGKVGDTYKTARGTVTKTANGVRHERSAGKEEKEELDEVSDNTLNSYLNKAQQDMEGQAQKYDSIKTDRKELKKMSDRLWHRSTGKQLARAKLAKRDTDADVDEGIMGSIKSAFGGDKKPAARAKAKPNFRTAPEPQGNRRKESEYGANNWLAGNVNEESDESKELKLKISRAKNGQRAANAERPVGFDANDEVKDHSLRADPSKPAYIKKVTEVSKNTLQNYADASKRDYNSMNVWAKDEGMGPYSERVKSDAEDGSNPHWSTKQQSKRVAGLKAAKARGVTPGHKTGGSYVSTRDQLRSDSRGMFENTNNFDTPDKSAINELSKDTMRSYVDKGRKSNNAYLAKDEKSDKDVDTFYKRAKGIASASSKITKESFGTPDESEHAYLCVHVKKGKTTVHADSSYGAAKKAAAKWGLKSTAGIDSHLADKKHSTTSIGEERVNELSKNTLGSYIKKAKETAKKEYETGEQFDNQSQRHDRAGEEGKADDSWRTANKHFAKSNKRVNGIGKAVSKITKESFDTPDAPDESAIAKRKRLQAMRDRQEDERAARGNDDYNTPMTRKVPGRAYGGAAQQDDSEFAGASDDKLKKGFVNQQDNSLGVKWKKTGMGGAIDPNLDEAKDQSTYTVLIRKARDGRTRESSGTLEELVQSFGYTLEVGKSYEHERGNRKINMNPRNIEALVNNLNNAKSNSAANGAPDVYYSVGKNTTEPSIMAEEGHEDDSNGISIQAAALCPGHKIVTAWGTQTVVGLDRMMSRVKTDSGYDEKMHNVIVDAIMNGKSRIKTDWGVKNRNGVSDMVYRHNGISTDLEEGVEFNDKIKNSQAKWKKEPMKLKESKILKEGVEDVLKRFPHEVKSFEAGGEIDDDLYYALYDHYLNNGEMPYGVAKARSGDPMEWVCQRLEGELGLGESLVDVNQSSIASPTNNMPVTQELDEIAALAGLARPAATAVATNVASNLMDETTDTAEVDSILSKVGTGELDAYDVMNNPKNPIEQSAANEISRMYDEVASSYRLHPDDDFERIYDIVADRLASDYQVFDSPSKELDEIAALAGLAAKPAATTVASNMLADDADNDLSGLSDAELIRMAHQDGIEDMIVTDRQGSLVNRSEIINQLDSSFLGTNADPMQEEDSDFFKNPLATNTVTLEEEGIEEADPRTRDIEYTNSPREKTAGIQAAIPSGTDQSRIKKQYRKEYPGDNHMAVKEDANERYSRVADRKQAKVNDIETKLKASGYSRSKDAGSEYQYKWTKEGSTTYIVNYRHGNNGYAEYWKQAVKEDALWKSYQAMLTDVTTKK